MFADLEKQALPTHMKMSTKSTGFSKDHLAVSDRADPWKLIANPRLISLREQGASADDVDLLSIWTSLVNVLRGHLPQGSEFMNLLH